MVARQITPINKNFLSQLEFKLVLNRAPHVNFFVQKVNIASISLPSTKEAPNPFVKIPYAGDHIEYSNFVVDFKVDEDFKNYMEIHNWIKALGFPDSYSQYREIYEKPQSTGEGIRSDITLIIANSVKRGNYEIVYRDCIPVFLSELSFSTSDPDVEYLTARAEFDYISYNISRLNDLDIQGN